MARSILRILPRIFRVFAFAFLVLPTFQAFSQATSAGREIPASHVDVFLAGTLTHTGFVGSNKALTGGASLSFRHIFTFEPALEVRATTSLFNSDTVARERSFLVGPVLRRRIGRFEPYGDFLWGRGTISYPSDYSYDDTIYARTADSMHEFGGGIGYRLNDLWSLKFDIQQQLWSVPVITSGHAYARSASFGITRRFDLHHHEKERVDKNDPKWHKLCDDHPLLCQK
ncbi:MAG: hypothetical protein PW792_14220 [Acidobacteriaceae bacterium]|nr:hypothetical protein [Acidobacteriaceae bacterium]